MPRLAGFFASTVVLAVMAVYAATHFRTTSELLPFFAEGGGEELAGMARELSRSPMSRRMVLAVGSTKGEARAIEAGRLLEERLRKREGIQWVRGGVDPALVAAVHELYFPRRLLFLSDQPKRDLPRLLSPEGLAERAARLKHELGLPSGPLIRQLAPADPWLIFPAILERIEGGQSGHLRPVDGRFVSSDGCAMLFVGLRAPAFDTEAQRGVLDAIRRIHAEVKRDLGDDVTLEQSGLNRFAVESEDAIRGDVTRISVVSTIAVLALLVLVFGSVRYVALCAVPVLAAFVAATAVALLVFGRLHALTFAFGGTLIGVSMDYPVHYLNHHRLTRAGVDPAVTAREAWTGLVLAGATSAIGLAGLSFSTFPGIREVAIFSTVGLAAAVVCTRTLLPALSPPSGGATRAHAWLSRAASLLLDRMQTRRRALLFLPLAAVLVCALGLPRATWVDDLRSLSPSSPSLEEEDARVRARLGGSEMGRFVVALGKDMEEALQANDAVYGRLDEARKAGLVEGFDSLHAFLWSWRLQEENRAVLSADADVADRVRAALTAADFDAEAFSPFFGELGKNGAPPLDFATLSASALGPLVDSFVTRVGERTAVVSFLRGGGKAGAGLEERLADLPGVRYFDYRSTLDAAYKSYRQRTMELLAIGLLLVLAVIYARHRSVRVSLSAFLPAVLAGVTALSLMSLFGVPFHLLHVLSLLLVLSMGVDYGVFLFERDESAPSASNAVLSVFLSCLTTVFSFGMLALSQIPALRAIGQTTSLGIVLCVIFAPTFVVLAKTEPVAPGGKAK